MIATQQAASRARIAPPSIRSKGLMKGGATRIDRALPSVLLLLAAGALFASAFLPLWRIKLDAPQYPEGMGMLISARSITGENPNDLAILNQLNHYIGMKVIVPESIPELRYIASIILSAGLLCLLVAIRPRIWSIMILLGGLMAAGAAGLVDFWLWEYDYGHNLNPMAAIKVPGMSYQPPLIGSAKLLNFTSTSWPAAGGLLLFAAGLLIVAALFFTWRRKGRTHVASIRRAPLVLVSMLALSLPLAACNQGGPAPVHWGEDACHHCRMTLVQHGFAAERVNKNGKALIFDTIECLLADLEKNPPKAGEIFFVSDRSLPNAPLLPSEKAMYLHGGGIISPMGGALAAFGTVDSARAFQTRLGGEIVAWQELLGQ